MRNFEKILLDAGGHPAAITTTRAGARDDEGFNTRDLPKCLTANTDMLLTAKAQPVVRRDGRVGITKLRRSLGLDRCDRLRGSLVSTIIGNMVIQMAGMAET